MNVLERIFEFKKAEVAGLRQNLGELKSRVADTPPTRGFHRALVESAHPVSLIAEVKKASPVKGLIREDFQPEDIARKYKEVGVDCLSVLTDIEFFQGAPEYLKTCRDTAGIPVLRKDFTVAEYHVYEARALEADAILLIANGLTDSQLKEYRELACSLGMDTVVEVHTEEEAGRALESGAELVGINNRNLETFETDLNISATLIPTLSGKVTVVSESALSSYADIERAGKLGARSVLIGTRFCKQPDIKAAVREVMGW